MFIVKPYLIYPPNYPTNSKYQIAIESYMLELQQWYHEKMGGKTFQYSPLEVFISTEEYNMENLPYSLNRVIHSGSEEWEDGVIAFIFAAGGGGWACGYGLDNQTKGYAVVGDGVLKPLIGEKIPQWYGEGTIPKGTGAHELGHAFGIHEHPKLASLSIMSWQGNYPYLGFLDYELDILRSSPFFNTHLLQEREEEQLIVFEHPPRIVDSLLMPPGYIEEVKIKGNYDVPDSALYVLLRLSIYSKDGSIGQDAIVQFSNSVNNLDNSLGQTTQSSEVISETGWVKLNNGSVYLVSPLFNKSSIIAYLELQGYQ